MFLLFPLQLIHQKYIPLDSEEEQSYGYLIHHKNLFNFYLSEITDRITVIESYSGKDNLLIMIFLPNSKFP